MPKWLSATCSPADVTLNVDGRNDGVRFTLSNGDAYRTATMPEGVLSNDNLEDRLESLGTQMNELLEYNANEIGVQLSRGRYGRKDHLSRRQVL